MENTDVSVMLDNHSIYDILRKNLGIQRPTYKNINRLIAQFISLLTTSIRFSGAVNGNLK